MASAQVVIAKIAIPAVRKAIGARVRRFNPATILSPRTQERFAQICVRVAFERFRPIAKRARPGHPAVFEFRADQAGTFPYYCNLKEGASSHDMRGELVVR